MFQFWDIHDIPRLLVGPISSLYASWNSYLVHGLDSRRPGIFGLVPAFKLLDRLSELHDPVVHAGREAAVAGKC